VGRPEEGVASTAAAGLLIAHLEQLPEQARPLFADSLARYPEFVEFLREYDETLAIIPGVIDRGEHGDVLAEQDGAIDNVRLVAALRRALASYMGRISLARDLVTELEVQPRGIRAVTSGGRELISNQVVIAAGAWSPQIAGLPRPLPIRPLKGQMIALGATVTDRAIMGRDVYIVPRGDETLVGATVEEAGFDVGVTDDAAGWLRSRAIELVPELATAPVTRSWAGIRPATPDMLPIIGQDPNHVHVIYASGHSKNGVLLAPATAAAVVELAYGRPTPTPIDAFSIGRFAPQDRNP
jgi:glycine oxidase